MAFSSRSLSRVSMQVVVGSTAGAPKDNQVSLFLYATDDAAAVVETAGYFNTAREQLQKGDQISASLAVSGTPVLKHYVVTASPSAGNVTIAVAT